MANPRPRFHTTGQYNSRHELKMAVRLKKGHQAKNWTQIGKECGVSARTAKRVHEEDERQRLEARAVAYNRATTGSVVGAVTGGAGAAPRSTLTNAHIITVLAIMLLLIATAVAVVR